MKNNIDLNEEKLDAFANAAVQYNIEKQLRTRYDKILADRKFSNPKKTTVFQLSTFTKVAAVIVSVLGCLFMMQLFVLSPSAQNMAQVMLDETHISSNPDVTRKGTSSVSQTRREANDAYTLKNYPLAISKYESLQSQNEVTALDQFYLGVSHLRINNLSESIATLNNMRDAKNFEPAEVEWLLSLAYVLSDQEQLAIPLLQKLVSDGDYKSKDAKKLLNKLK